MDSGNVMRILFAIAVLSIQFKTLRSLNVTWHVETKPIIFQENVTLECNIENCCDPRISRTWTGGRNNKFISIDNQSVNTSKYIPAYTDHGYKLTITNFDLQDINKDYTCIYSFGHHTKNLTLLDKDYRMYPMKDELESTFNFSERTITANIMFDVVYPKPECQVKLDDNVLYSRTSDSDQRANLYFYKTTTLINYTIDQKQCGDLLSIDCLIGCHSRYPCKSINIANVNITSATCENHREKKNEVNSMIPILVAILALCLLICVSVFVCYKKGTIRKSIDLCKGRCGYHEPKFQNNE